MSDLNLKNQNLVYFYLLISVMFTLTCMVMLFIVFEGSVFFPITVLLSVLVLPITMVILLECHVRKMV
jgi:hypothetical protein